MSLTFRSSDIFKCIPRQPTYHQIMEMMKRAENELEIKLCEKRERLKIQLANEERKYSHEINEKYRMEREFEIDEQCKNLQRLRMERELDGQKYIEIKQLQQQIQNSEELRLKLSRRLLDECVESRHQQIEEKRRAESLTRAAENALIEEQRLQQQKEQQKEYEAEKIRQQKQWEARQELDKQVAIKRERELLRKQQEEIELKFLQQADETAKKCHERIESERQQEIQQQKGFLRFQIERRKSLQELRRQQEIELAKAEIERINRDERLMAEAHAQAKHAKNTEILQFNGYMHRVRSDREKIHMDRTDWTQVQRANNQLEVNAEIERQKRRQLLNAEQRSEYLKKSNEKRAAQRREKKMEFYNFHQTQEQNAQYEELMAEKRQQHRSQFINDLDQQMQLKTMQKARTMKSETVQNQKINEIAGATSALNHKLLLNDDDIEELPKHPFYRRLKSRFK